MDGTAWLPQFERVVSARLVDPPAPGSLRADLVLAKAGLDSLETIGLTAGREETFDVSIPDDLLTAETFTTPSALLQTLRHGLRSRGV